MPSERSADSLRRSLRVRRILITSGTMFLVSLFAGWEPRGELSHVEQPGWLRTSQLAIQKLNAEDDQTSTTGWLPLLLACVALAVGCWLSFVFFW